MSGPAPETGPGLGNELGLGNGPELESAGRPEIRSSWLRCLRSGLRPEAEVRVSRLHDFDRRSRLLAAAAPVLDGLARHLEDTGFALLLADSSDDLPGATRGLASYLPGRIALPPLRSYREQLPALLRAMAVASGARPRRLSAAAQAILISQPWPGNLRELADVAATLHAGGASGEIQSDQLPEGYRRPGMPGRLTRLEQAERDAIWGALRANGGNKAKTAVYLGISRTTLYKALRSLGIWA